MIDCVALSDLHGYLPEDIKPFDLMLLAGDIVDLYSQDLPHWSEEWYLGDFLDWINTLPFKDENSKVVMIEGNHALGLYRMTPEQKQMFLIALKTRSNDRIVYLEHEEYTFTLGDESIKIFGTPWCKIFGRWAFMADGDTLKEKYSQIPDDIDILISHDAPSINNVGTIQQKTRYTNPPMDVGNPQLTEAILEKKFKLSLHGHIHSGNHELSEYAPKAYIRNVSILDEEYIYTYKPFYFTWPLSD